MREIDSLNFLPMALVKLPDAFQLEDTAKGSFLHHFPKRERMTYVGEYPKPEDYDCDAMSIDQQK